MDHVKDDPRRVAGPDELDDDFPSSEPDSDEAYEQLRDESIMANVMRIKRLADSISAPASVGEQFSQVFGGGQ
jgi:hypothetical protein